jgi:hypothetical protein
LISVYAGSSAVLFKVCLKPVVLVKGLFVDILTSAGVMGIPRVKGLGNFDQLRSSVQLCLVSLKPAVVFVRYCYWEFDITLFTGF